MKKFLSVVARKIIGGRAKYKVVYQTYLGERYINPVMRFGREDRQTFVIWDGIPNLALEPANWQAKVIERLCRVVPPKLEVLTPEEIIKIANLEFDRKAPPFVLSPDAARKLYKGAR